MTKLDLIKAAVLTPDLTDLIALFFFLAFAIMISFYLVKIPFLTILSKILAHAISKAFFVEIEIVD